MRILITGGFGFVGGRLAVHMAHVGHTIVIGSRNAAAPPVWLPQAEVIQTNWDDAAALERCCKGVDVVVQAAGMNSLDCVADPVAALAFNGVATARLLAAACRAGVRRFIYLSTAHVYASPLEGYITEETCPRNLHPYATSHLAGEQAVLGATQRRQIQGIVLRLSNAFGVPMHRDVNCWMLLTNDLCRQAISDQRLVLTSSGIQHRDFLSLTELCRVAGQILGNDLASGERAIFNVGTGVSKSVLGMAQLIQSRCERVLGFEPAILVSRATVNEECKPLLFECHGLERVGLQVSQDLTSEIDLLLRFCQANFGVSTQ